MNQRSVTSHNVSRSVRSSTPSATHRSILKSETSTPHNKSVHFAEEVFDKLQGVYDQLKTSAPKLSKKNMTVKSRLRRKILEKEPPKQTSYVNKNSPNISSTPVNYRKIEYKFRDQNFYDKLAKYYQRSNEKQISINIEEVFSHKPSVMSTVSRESARRHTNMFAQPAVFSRNNSREGGVRVPSQIIQRKSISHSRISKYSTYYT